MTGCGCNNRIRNVEIPLLVITGPTAAGKTELGIKLAEMISGEIVSADSRQVYRFMDIGTAKPSMDERRKIPHHMIDVVSPDEEFTVADYVKGAGKAIIEISNKGKMPVMVGGTGLYVRAVVDGIFDGPGSDTEIRRQLEEEAKKKGVSYLHERLGKIDPDASLRIHPNDRRRIIRALEIYEITGYPISRLQKDGRKRKQEYSPKMFGINRSREELYRRIDERVENIFRTGFVEEVKMLMNMGYGENLISMEALGYREVIRFLNGKMDLEKTKSKIKKDTRNYAKRQLTWFRKDRRINWLNVKRSEKEEKIVEGICRFVQGNQ